VEALRVLNYRTWNLFGHSMGAVLALDIAASHPDETGAVVALSPTALTAVAALNQPLRHPAMAPLVGMYAIMSALRALGRSTPTLLRIAERTGLLRFVLSPLFARPFLLRREVFTDLAADARPASFVAAASALRRYDAGTWQSIAAPTILARGSRDIFTPSAELRALANLIPHARSVVLAGSGHFAHIEDPAAIAELLTTLCAAAEPLDGLD
jgi:pimeloyl-ACP methyl ester carboxylesterase